MSKLSHRRAKTAASPPWLAIAGLWGAGLLPCPSCGAPMLLHFWPVALALTLAKLRRGKHLDNVAHSSADAPVPSPENDHAGID